MFKNLVKLGTALSVWISNLGFFYALVNGIKYVHVKVAIVVCVFWYHLSMIESSLPELSILILFIIIISCCQ